MGKKRRARVLRDTRGGVRPAGLSPRTAEWRVGRAGLRGLRPAIAEKCRRATASAAERPARRGVVRVRARALIECGLGRTARGAGRERRRCDGGAPPRPGGPRGGYGCGAPDKWSGGSWERQGRRRWPTRGPRGAGPRVLAAVSHEPRSSSFATDGLRSEVPAGGGTTSYAGAVGGSSRTADPTVEDAEASSRGMRGPFEASRQPSASGWTRSAGGGG